MSAAELATPTGRERAALCVFQVPIGERLVSMCEVNALGVRERYYAAGPACRPDGRQGAFRLAQPALLHDVLGGGAFTPSGKGKMDPNNEPRRGCRRRRSSTLAIGHYMTRALGVATKLGIAELLTDGPRHAEALAAATGTHAPSLRRVLRLLASAGVFDRGDDGQFALTPLGECPAPRRARPARRGDALRRPRVQDGVEGRSYCVAPASPPIAPVARHRRRSPTMAQDPEEAAIFDEAMAEFTPLTAVAVAAAYDFSRLRARSSTSAAATARCSLGILQREPRLRGIVFDQPPSRSGRGADLAERGLADRCDRRRRQTSSRRSRRRPTPTC